VTISAFALEGEEATNYYNRARESLQFRLILEFFTRLEFRMQESSTQVLKLIDSEEETSGVRVHISYDLESQRVPRRYQIIQAFFSKNHQETIGYALLSSRLYTRLLTDDFISRSEPGLIHEEWDGGVLLQERTFEPEILLT
jgi:hypothetical protein